MMGASLVALVLLAGLAHAQQEPQCAAEVRSREWPHEKCQSHCAAGDCPPLHCICSINPHSSEVVVAPVDKERCYQFHASDDTVHLFVMLNATEGSLKALLRSGTGAEGHRLRPSRHEHDLEVEQGTIARLSRDEWRETAAKDEGEWTGDWTLCLVGTGTASLVVMVTECPVDDQGDECSGKGECNDRMVSEGCHGTMTTCRRSFCGCQPGYGGERCGEWVGFPPPPAVVPMPESPPPPPLPPPFPPPSPFPQARPETPPAGGGPGGGGDGPSPAPGSGGGGHLSPSPTPAPPDGGSGGDDGPGGDGGGGGGGVRPGEGKIVHATSPPSSGLTAQVGFWLAVLLLTCCGWAGIQYYFHLQTGGGGGGNPPQGMPFPFGHTVVMGIPMKGFKKWGKAIGAKYTEMTELV